MSVEVKPFEQLEFRGLFTAGNPIQRPRNSAEVCRDFRVMPGHYLRLRAGRFARYCIGGANDIIRQIALFRTVDYSGSDHQLAQIKWASGVCEWHWFTVGTYIMAPPGMPGATFIETITRTHDGSFATDNPAATCNLDDRPVVYNGLGVRDTVNSRPPFSHALDGATRYFGLDAYCPYTTPGATFTAGAGGFNKVQTWVRIHVGLYHEPSEHYSNGVYAGEIKSTNDAVGTITVDNLSGLSYASHGAAETAELFYVFYATIDGFSVPFLVLNSTLDGPYKVPVGANSASLSIIADTTNGWVLDYAKEVPIENFPPRPMRSICYVNGRLYGSLFDGGYDIGWGDRRFDYRPSKREYAAVVWSAAASDSQEKDYLGDPLQSWPYFNIAYTPSGEQPIVVAPADDATRVLVVTSASCFYLQEAADGIHEYFTISRTHGIAKAASLVTTRYGIVWVDQRNQIVILRPGAREVETLSVTYQEAMVGAPQCADYVYDPLTEVDRYQVWLTGGLSVCHDFRVNEAYTATNQDFTAAQTVMDSMGKLHHLVAKNGVYTQERQPWSGLVHVTDETFTGVGQNVTVAEINGYYVRNVDDFGDSDVRKELPMVDVIGDTNVLAIDYWGDFSTAAGVPLIREAIPQSLTIPAHRYKLPRAHYFWYKLRLQLAGHSADAVKPFYGSIVRASWRLGIAEGRM